MRGKKALLADIWSRFGLAGATLSLGVGSRSTLLILAYHRILDLANEDAHPGDPELVSATPRDFERQMRFVRDHFKPLRFAEVLQSIDRSEALPKRSLVVTFDDGHLDNYTHAFPILKALGVPATIFVSTQYIDAPHTPFWFDHVAQLMYFAPAGNVDLDTLNFHTCLDSVASRRNATAQVLHLLKRQSNERRLAAMDELVQRYDSHRPLAQRSQRAAMNWDEVQEMSRAGIEFGSHTVTHPVLTQLDDVSIMRELSISKEVIAAHIGQPVDTLAYPVGKSLAFDDRVIRAAQTCGYRLGVSYESGVNPSSDFSRYALRRLAVERYVSWGHFQAMLSLPGVFAE